MTKGQTSLIGAVVGLGAMALTTFGFYTASNVRTDNKIATTGVTQTQTLERVARLEEAITTLKSDNIEIKRDLKEVLKLLK